MSLAGDHLRCVLGAALLLALSAVPRAGWASCGDYLHHAVQSTAFTEPDRGDEDGPLRPTPCRGPHCSQRTPAPASPAAPKFSPVGPRYQMYWCVQVPADEVGASWKLDRVSDTHSLLAAGRLFRPPRAS
jgi:hypothetical protein